MFTDEKFFEAVDYVFAEAKEVITRVVTEDGQPEALGFTLSIIGEDKEMLLEELNDNFFDVVTSIASAASVCAWDGEVAAKIQDQFRK